MILERFARQRQVGRRRAGFDQEASDVVRRVERARIAQLESSEGSAGSSQRGRQAGRSEGVLGGAKIAGDDLQSTVPMRLEGLAVELLDEPPAMDDADPGGEPVDLGQDVA